MRRLSATKSLVAAAVAVALAVPAVAYAGGGGTPAPPRPAQKAAPKVVPASAHVEVVKRTADGGMIVDSYTPAPGYTAEQLEASLRRQGLPAKIATDDDSAAVEAGRAVSNSAGSATANSAGQPCWAWQTARLFTGTFCFVRWKRGRFSQSQIRLADRTHGAWPVRAATRDWNKSSAINLQWNRTCAGRSKGVNCITVVSGKYGRKVIWGGRTSLRWYRAKNGRFYYRSNQPHMVQLNGSYRQSARGYRRLVCHELGHALGLGHTVGGGASCLNENAWVHGRGLYTRPTMDDLILLKRISLEGL